MDSAHETFERSRGLGIDLVVLDRAESTNDELVARAHANEVADFTSVVTLDQTAGRGRLGREWVSPAGKALAVSVLLRTDVDSEHWGWIPLLAGVAMTRVVADMIPDASVTLKWPNDVLVATVDGERKVSGVLSELVSDGTIVVGAGLNLTLTAAELPVETATSLALNGATGSAEQLADRALAGFVSELRSEWQRFVEARGDAGASGLRLAVTELCGTLGRDVRVELPGALEHVGRAVGIDRQGHLLVSAVPSSDASTTAHEEATNRDVLTVAAGDVTHLRYE